MNIKGIQLTLREQHLDGWLFCDHHHRDPLAYRVLGLDETREVTRRWFYLIPVEGEPRALMHKIEKFVLEGMPGEKAYYSSWGALVDGITHLVRGCRRVAMQYSPRCAIPSLSLVDAGTVELVRGTGLETVSSADLIQFFEARWDEVKLSSHLEAGRLVDAILAESFALAGERIRLKTPMTEWQLAEFIRERFRANRLITDHGPIVSVNQNAANPHYEPAERGSSPIQSGDVLLIDLWAKLDKPHSVYYDITWTGFCGKEVPAEVRHVFEVVREARDKAVQRVQSAVETGEHLCGYEVDDAARSSIRESGYGEYFVHRTGHSIGEDVHAAGANMDNLETHDERRVIPWTCFSIEPGVYLPGFGIRSEVNVFVDERSARVTGEIQQEMILV
jgi:Xaa-Pro aminopeptidase